MLKRSIFSVTVVVCGLVGYIRPANAVNNDLWIGLCNPCSTTLQFEQAAVSLISASEKYSGQPWNKTYTYVAIMSNTASSTAFISVSGYWSISARRPTFFPQTYIPVDASGNSLANQSESYLQQYYTTVDWSVYGVDRSDPITVPLLDGNAEQDFIGTPDTSVSANIVNNGLPKGTDYPPGTPITVEFADGITAIFTRTTNTTPSDNIHWWVWGNIAHLNKNLCGMAGNSKVCGAPVDRNGHMIINKNTSGTTGGGSQSNPFYIYPTPLAPSSPNYCTYSVSYEDADGNTIESSGYGPC